MNAKPRDSEEGWKIYKASGYAASTEEINAQLTPRGFNPISERTYRHYKKLATYGYERYVPINQLDVETLRDPIWDTPLRHRYISRSTNLAVTLVFVLGDIMVLQGEMVELSDLEATVVISEQLPQHLKIKPRTIVGSNGLILLEADDRARPVSVESATSTAGGTFQLHMSFLEVVSPDKVPGRQPLPSAALQLTVSIDDSQYLLNTVRTLNLLAEALEATRIVCDEALAQLDPAGKFVLTPPEIVSLSRTNPVILVVGLPVSALMVFGAICAYITKSRKVWHAGSIPKAQAKVIEQQAQMLGQGVELVKEYVRSQRMINDKAELGYQLEPTGVSKFVVEQVQKNLGQSESSGLSQLTSADSATAHKPPEEQRPRIEKLVEHQLLPAMTQLFGAPVRGIQQSSASPIPDLPNPLSAGEAIEN